MTSVARNVGTGLQRRVGSKEKKMQSNKSNHSVINDSANDSEQTLHNSDKSKSDHKLQPTAEQIRIANMMNDKMDDNDLKAKIDQIIELTGSSRDEAVVALHDCDNDTAKAIDMILEGDSVMDSQWRSTGKKKKPPKNTSALTGDDSNSRQDMNINRDSKSDNRDSKAPTNKSDNRPNNRVNTRGGGPPRLQRAALANRGQRRERTKESNRNLNDRPEVEEQSNDIFSSSAQQQTFRPSDGSAPPRRVDRRGRGRGGLGRGGNRGAFSGPAGRGSRTFQNRGLQSNDGFPNSIDTWTNSTADQPSNKTVLSTDCNTMTVGNWSDIAANEDWSEEDWEPSHMETKVFTPSAKISEKEEIEVRDLSSNLTGSQTSNLSPFMAKPSVDSSQSSSMNSLLSRNPSVAGQVLLQQIQQSSAGQTPTLNQYSLSYNKQATESIKSLVGLSSSAAYNSNSSDLLSTNERDLDSLSNSQTSSLSNKASRMKPTRPSKIPESAVEMPSNDTITALGVHFGTLEFGSENNQFSLGADSSVFADPVGHTHSHTNKAKKSEPNSLSNSSLLSQPNDSTYRSSTTNINDSTNKVVNSSIIQNSVLGHQSLTSDSLLDHNSKSNVGQFAQKVLDRTNKSSDYSSVSPAQIVNVADITSPYKTTYSDTAYNSSNYSTAASTNYPYSSNSQSGGYVNQGVSNYSTNFSGSTIGHSNASTQKLRDIDSNSQQKQYEVSNSIGSLGPIQSNSTVTTNVLKSTLSATGKMHSVPPGVGPVLSTPSYIVQNTGVPIYPMGIPYDLQFQQQREHSFGPYGTQDVKYGRGTESEVIPVSTSQTGASHTQNQTFVNTFPPGYSFYLAAPGINMMPAQSIYPTAGPLYPVAQPQSTGSASSAFGKANNTYGSHSYNSGYDSISGVAQNQDYVKQSYPQSVQQHNKSSNASDLTSNNSSIYGKNHSQINKSYDKQGFQGATPPFNMTGQSQSNNMSSTYGGPYVLPHSQLHTMSSLQTDVSQPGGPGVTGQRSLSQTHKNSGTGANNYAGVKYNWN